jgi:hypothetical protein
MINSEVDRFGTQRLWVNEKLHRTDGPAVTYADGTQYWYVSGFWYRDNKSFQEAANLSDEDMTAIILKYGNIKYDSFIYK